MKCKDANKQLNAHIDGELAAQAGEALSAHLKECAACRREEENLRRLDGVLATFFVPPVPEGLSGRITSAARDELSGTQKDRPADLRVPRPSLWRLPQRMFAPLTGFAAVVLLLLGAYVGADLFTPAESFQPSVSENMPPENTAEALYVYESVFGLLPPSSPAEKYVSLLEMGGE